MFWQTRTWIAQHHILQVAKLEAYHSRALDQERLFWRLLGPTVTGETR
jgi:hypothetical protein